ncbi:hypothetical protein KSP40_PGU003900 [Platanthera guangdongensis]|uniref:Uncharacterized protein n=1 Tax=Platanthera guangdongensis TaxID=2320717 RepID=A0ABR2LWL0_9ASPA
MFLKYKNVNTLDYVFMVSFFLDKPTSKWIQEFLRDDICHDWHHFKIPIQNRFRIEVPLSHINLDSNEAKSEEYDPCGTLEEPIFVQAPIIHVGEEILSSFVSPPSKELSLMSFLLDDSGKLEDEQELPIFVSKEKELRNDTNTLMRDFIIILDVFNKLDSQNIIKYLANDLFQEDLAMTASNKKFSNDEHFLTTIFIFDHEGCQKARQFFTKLT